MKPFRWSYGVITVPQRLNDLLPQTLRSLAAAGFESPRLFIDGQPTINQPAWLGNLTMRRPSIGLFLNWALTLWELYGREPSADWYAIFQDDLLAVQGLRDYLEKTLDNRANCYYNLYTGANNEDIVKGQLPGWRESAILSNGGDVRRFQTGRGALGLVFSREAVKLLLSSSIFVTKPTTAVHPDRCVDGLVVDIMNRSGWREMIHGPSLLQHTGIKSVIGNSGDDRRAATFPGEEWDARSLLTGVS